MPFENLMSKLFGAAPTAQPAAATQLPAAPAPAQQAAAGTGVVPAGSGEQGTTPNPEPLSGFADLWNPPVDDKGVAIPARVDAPMFTIDDAKLMASAQKVDFSKAVSPDIMAAIQKGGPEAAAALLQALNSVSQLTYAQSAKASTQLIESAITKARESFRAELPDLVKSQSINESLRTSNPLFSNPAVAPMLNMVKEQMQLKNPNASIAEVTQMAQNYVLQFADIAAPKKQVETTTAPGDQDWSKFLE